MGFAYVLETSDCPEQLSSTHPGFLYSEIEHSYMCGTYYMPFILTSRSYSNSSTLNKNKPIFLCTKCCPAVLCARVLLQSRGHVLSYEGWTVQLTLVVFSSFPIGGTGIGDEEGVQCPTPAAHRGRCAWAAFWAVSWY